MCGRAVNNRTRTGALELLIPGDVLDGSGRKMDQFLAIRSTSSGPMMDWPAIKVELDRGLSHVACVITASYEGSAGDLLESH